MKKILILSLFFTLLSPFSYADEAATPVWHGDVSMARLVSAVDAFQPGKPFRLGLDVHLKPGWHTYTDPAGDAGIPPQFTWVLPAGFSASEIAYPPHLTFVDGGITTYGYVNQVFFPVAIAPPSDAATGNAYPLRLKAGWLVCKDICIPQETEFTLNIPAESSEKPSAFAKQFSNPETSSPAPSHGNVFAAMLFALLGGVILNLMPCVFPVLSLKCLAIAKHGKDHRREGIAYTLGILLCFALLGGAMIALQQAGAAVGWGYQMQSPVFVASMALVLFLVGMSLTGVFTLPVLLGSAQASGAFATGALAALVATPCTAPLMAPAVGVALSQPPIIAMLIFEMIGLGLALPFLLVSFMPKLMHAMPKPGAWMERLKQFLAFPMYASAVWLTWVLAQQVGPNAVGCLLLAMLFCAFCFWLKPRGTVLAMLIGLTAAASLAYVHMLPAMPSMLLAQEGGEAFSETRLAQLRAQGKPVFVDATAAWCITCRVNHFSTLVAPAVREAFKQHGVVELVADWTARDSAIAHYLASFGYNGVPLYVYYPPHGEPKVLPQILTPQIVVGVVR